MREHQSFVLFRLIGKPRFILCSLAVCNFISVPVRFSAVCFYNWNYQLWLAFLLVVAGSALWLEKRWGFLGAAVLSGPMVFDFAYSTMKVFDVIAKSPEEAKAWGTREDWWHIMVNHPEEPFQIVLAAAIFVFAVVYLIGLLKRRRPVLP